MIRRVLLISLAVVLAISSGLVGCDGGGNGDEVSELRIALPSLYDESFHPLWGTLFRGDYIEPLYDFIVGVNADGDWDPDEGVAYAWEEAPGGMNWTFYIRDGIEFHNGDPLTAEDVAYTMEQAATDKNLAGFRPEYQAHIDYAEVVAPDEVVLHLKKPWGNILYYLSTLTGTQGMVQPKAYIEANGEDYFRANPVGSGPYRLYDYSEGVHIKYEAVENHWRVGTPVYEYLTFLPMPETSARAAALQTGEVEIIRSDVATTSTLAGLGFNPVPKQEGVFIALVPLWPFKEGFATNSSEVKQALWYAIDKQAILDSIMDGNGRVVGSSMSMMTWAIEYKEYDPTPYQPSTAQDLLEDAGYPDGFTIYLYSSVTNMPETNIVAEAVAGYWEDIGLDVQILEMPFETFRPIYLKEAEPPGPAVFIMQTPNRPVYSWRGMYHSTALYSHTQDPAMDALIETFEAATTAQEYIDRARDCMDYVLAEHLTTSLFVTDMLFVAQTDIPGWNMGVGVASYRWEYIGL